MTVPVDSRLRPRPSAARAGATVAAFVVVLVLVFVGTRLGLARQHPAVPSAPSTRQMVVTLADGEPVATAADFAAVRGVPQAGNRLGSPRAPVTVVEFEDPQCVACKQYDLGAADLVTTQLVRTGRATVLRYPLTFIGPESVPAARWAFAAGRQGLMWQFMRAFHLNAGAENSGDVTTARLRQVARLVPGLDVSRTERDAASPQAGAFLDSSRRLAARLHVTGTPSVLVGRDADHLRAVPMSSSTDFAAVRGAVRLVSQGKALPARPTTAGTCGAGCTVR